MSPYCKSYEKVLTIFKNFDPVNNHYSDNIKKIKILNVYK